MTNAFTSDQHPRNNKSGQFEESKQSDPEVALDSITADVDIEFDFDAERTVGRNKAYDFAEHIRSTNPRVHREAAEAMTEEVIKTVRQMRFKRGLSQSEAEDAIGDVLLDLTKKVKAGSPILGGLINTSASAVTSRYVNHPSIHHETTRALTILKKEVAAEEARVGHNLGAKSIADIADSIRMGTHFKAQHRPAKDFQNIENWARPTSFSQFDDSYIDQQMEKFGYGAGSTQAGADSPAFKLAEQIEMKDVSRKDALVRLWDVLADDRGVPSATQNRVNRKDAKAMSDYMKEDPARVLKACHDYEDGIQNKGTVALFAPFGELRTIDRDNITDMLLSHTKHATDLWSSALSAATKPAELEAEERSAKKASSKVPA